MVHRSTWILSLAICLSPMAFAEHEQKASVCMQSASDSELIAGNLRTQAHRMVQTLEEIAQHEQTNTTWIRDAICSLENVRNIEEPSHDTLIESVKEIQLRAQQLHEFAREGAVTSGSRNIPPHFDTETPIAVLQSACDSVQSIIDDAINRLQRSEWQQYLVDSWETCKEWNLDIAGASLAGIAATAAAYHYWDSEAVRNACAYALKNKLSQMGISVACLTTAWTRYRTPKEISDYAPDGVRELLLAYKAWLANLPYPFHFVGNVDKRPEINTPSENLPSAQAFKQVAKDQGYDISETRIPGDPIDLKAWHLPDLNTILASPSMLFLFRELRGLVDISEDACGKNEGTMMNAVHQRLK